MMLSSSHDPWYCANCFFTFNFTDSTDRLTEHATGSDLQASLSSNRVITDERNSFPNVLVLNARSIRKKVPDLHAFDIAAMTETWLDRNHHECEFQLEGYNV